MNTTPLFGLDDPRELAAVLGLAFVKLAGDLTEEQKRTLISFYESELSFPPAEAKEMYRYASYAVGTDPNYASKLPEIVAPSRQKMTESQKRSTMALLRNLESQPGPLQKKFTAELERLFSV